MIEQEILTRILRILEQTIIELQKITIQINRQETKANDAYFLNIKSKK